MPTPAGPTTRTRRSDPATARAAVAWAGSRPSARSALGSGSPTALLAQAMRRASWSRTPAVVSWRSVTCTSGPGCLPSETPGCSSTQRLAAVSTSRSISSTISTASPAAPAGRSTAISRARSARSHVEDDPATRTRASETTAWESKASRDGPGTQTGTPTGPKPASRARPAHSPRRVSDPGTAPLLGRECSAARRSRRQMSSGPGSSPSCSSDQVRR